MSDRMQPLSFPELMTAMAAEYHTQGTICGERKFYKASRSWELFGERMEKYGTKVYLINTGWTGGAYGEGKRINLPYTRAMVTAALNGEIGKTKFSHHAIFNVDVPQHIDGVPDIVLNPRKTWKDKLAYDAQARKLAAMFEENAAKKYPNMEDAVREAGPHSK